MDKTCENLLKLIDIITQLRGPAGCPWDQKQTARTIMTYCLDETYELLDAIDAEDPEHVCEELGDFMFHIAFITHLFMEKGQFSLAGVLAGINEKMVRRHPHVFAQAKVDTEQELHAQWKEIKTREKIYNGPFSSIPKTLPALRRAQKVSKRAARSGKEGPDLTMLWDKIEEEITALKAASGPANRQEAGEKLGEVLFTLVNLGRLLAIDSEDALTCTVNKFINGFVTT